MFKWTLPALESVLRTKSIDYKILPSGEVAINSPYEHDTTFDCRINLDKQVFHDFESGEGGSITKLIEFITKSKLERLLSSFEGLEGSILNQTNFKEKKKTVNKIYLPDNLFSLDKRDHSYEEKQVINFLNSKMIDFYLAKKYNLKWTKKSYLNFDGRKIDFSYRIIIPHYENNELVYYQGRDYTGRSNLKYLNPPKEMHERTNIVPFYDQLEPNSVIFISEGPWEAMAYSGTCFLTSRISNEMSKKLNGLNPKALYLIPDNDSTGRLTLIKNIETLKNNIDAPIYLLKWWYGKFSKFKDPTDAKITFEELIKSDVYKIDKNFLIKLKLGEIWS